MNGITKDVPGWDDIPCSMWIRYFSGISVNLDVLTSSIRSLGFFTLSGSSEKVMITMWLLGNALEPSSSWSRANCIVRILKSIIGPKYPLKRRMRPFSFFNDFFCSLSGNGGHCVKLSDISKYMNDFFRSLSSKLWQRVLCDFQCATWHSLEQYWTVSHAEHCLNSTLGSSCFMQFAQLKMFWPQCGGSSYKLKTTSLGGMVMIYPPRCCWCVCCCWHCLLPLTCLFLRMLFFPMLECEEEDC